MIIRLRTKTIKPDRLVRASKKRNVNNTLMYIEQHLVEAEASEESN